MGSAVSSRYDMDDPRGNRPRANAVQNTCEIRASGVATSRAAPPRFAHAEVPPLLAGFVTPLELASTIDAVNRTQAESFLRVDAALRKLRATGLGAQRARRADAADGSRRRRGRDDADSPRRRGTP